MGIFQAKESDVLLAASLPKSIKNISDMYGDEYFYVLPWNEFGHSNWIKTWVVFRRNGVKLRLHKSKNFHRMVFRVPCKTNSFMRSVYKTRREMNKTR